MNHTAALAKTQNPRVTLSEGWYYSLRVGTIAQRAAFSPKRQVWRRSALGWVDALAAVPATEKG